jgi:hypothetical protein
VKQISITDDDDVDVNEAIMLYLRRYPDSNKVEFESYFGSGAIIATDRVHALLGEAMNIEPDWNRMTLNEAADYVEGVMRERHPGLTLQALEAIGNFYTFQMR